MVDDYFQGQHFNLLVINRPKLCGCCSVDVVYSNSVLSRVKFTVNRVADLFMASYLRKVNQGYILVRNLFLVSCDLLGAVAFKFE